MRTVALYLASVGMLGIPFYGKGYVMPLLLGAVVLCALWFLLQWKKNGQYVVRKRALNTSLLCMLMLMIAIRPTHSSCCVRHKTRRWIKTRPKTSSRSALI